jgi:hypothetical protein
MTLSERNLFFKAGIVFCAVSAILTSAASFLTIPVYPEMGESIGRPANFFLFLTGRLMESDYYAVHASLCAAVLFSLTGMILIYLFFERTSAPEIPYIAFFTVSFSFEVLRLILPLNEIYNFPSNYLLGTARVLLFARYFSIFSLFTAGICAAGFDLQKTRNAVLVIILAVLVITIGIPIDIQTWDTSFNMVVGYDSMFRMIEAIAFITTVISFLIAVNVRGSREYVYVAAGVTLAMAGRNIILGADNWIGPVLGILLLTLGTVLICTKLHKVHLWL